MTAVTETALDKSYEVAKLVVGRSSTDVIHILRSVALLLRYAAPGLSQIRLDVSHRAMVDRMPWTLTFIQLKTFPRS